MTERDTLQKLVDSGTVATALRQGSSARHAITALQTILHWLGFDKELNWKKYGADGDYGRATTSTVAAFAKRNGSTAIGKRIPAPLAEKIIARFDMLDELKQLAEDVDGKSVEKHYKRGSADKMRVTVLQELLHELGYTAELNWARFGADGDYGRSTAAAVAAYGRQQGIAVDGNNLSLQLAKNIIAELSPFYGPGWHTSVHIPTPAPGSLSIKSVVGKKNRQFVEVSDGRQTKRFGKYRKGLFTSGNQKPADFVTTQADKLRAANMTASEINVMIAVAENEGNLDAINTWDNAFLSFGLFQWTAGQGNAKGELPALLARIKDETPDLFEQYFGQHGLDVVDVAAGLIHGCFSLHGAKIKTAAAKDQLRQAPWAFRFWLAGQDPAVQAIEIKHALNRLDQFYTSERYKVADTFFVSDLVTSEYGVGLILDNHVNRPAYVRRCLAKALEETRLSNPTAWGTEEEARLIASYLKVRTAYGNSPMTDAEKRARVTKKYLTKGTISDSRGSFKRSRAAA